MRRSVHGLGLLLLTLASLMFLSAAGSADDREKGKEKGKGKGKSQIVEVDLSQLPKDLAKELKQFLKGSKDQGDAKKSAKAKGKGDAKEPKGKGKGDDKEMKKGKGKGEGKEAKKGEKLPMPDYSAKEWERRFDQLSRELDELRALLRAKKK